MWRSTAATLRRFSRLRPPCGQDTVYGAVYASFLVQKPGRGFVDLALSVAGSGLTVSLF